MSTALSALAPGQTATVCGFAGDEGDTAHLMQMGLVEGSEIEVLRYAPTGDPIEIRVMGYALSLRREEALHVLVENVRST